MKKQEITDLLADCTNTCKIVRTYFKYDDNYWYFYLNAANERFLLGQEENDFQLDGYHIRKVSDLLKAEVKDDLCEQINIWNGVVDQIKNPDMDISSWQSIFRSPELKDRLIIVQDEYRGVFVLGTIDKVYARKVSLVSIDADGEIGDEPFVFPYSQITHVAWNTRYSENWERYLKSHPIRRNEGGISQC